MDSLDWGVETVTVPKSMVSTGLNPSREGDAKPIDTKPAKTCKAALPSTGDLPDPNPREPKTLADKYGLKAMLAKLGDPSVDQSAKQAAKDKSALKKLKKCAPV